MSHHQTPTAAEQTELSIRTYRGIEIGLGQADPVAAIAAKLEAAHPGHLILVQAGKFLHGYDRTAHALATLKGYKLKLVGTAEAPHLRIGFPAGNFKRRLWSMVADFGIPYVVALGTQADGHTVYVSSQPTGNGQVLAAVTEQIVAQVIEDLRQRGEVNKSAARELLAHPDTAGFKLKSQAQALDTQLLQDVLKMPRDLRATYGENLRACMARIVRGVMAYGLEENKLELLRSLSADIDCLKHYLAQAPRLNRLKLAWAKYPGNLAAVGRRLAGVLIETRPAIEVIRGHDTPDSLFYVDPPYVHETRRRITRKDSARGYRHEMDLDDHAELLAALQEVQGMVVLSGYPHPIYDDALRGWERRETQARISAGRGTGTRTEVLWLNPACGAALHGGTGLFSITEVA